MCISTKRVAFNVCVCEWMSVYAYACSTHIIISIVCPLTMATINTTTASTSLCQLLHHLDKFTCSHGFHLKKKTWVTERDWRRNEKERERDKEENISSCRWARRIRSLNVYYRLGPTKILPICLHADFTPFVTYITYYLHNLYCCYSHFFSTVRFLWCIFFFFSNFRSVFGMPTNWLWL